MMRLTALVISAAFVITGCESDHDLMIKAMEKQISEVIHIDWTRDGVPLNGLLAAHATCKKEQGLDGCDVVESQLGDIAISIASCQADQRSRLCKVALLAIKIDTDHNLAFLPHADALPLPLPHSHWYWVLPTRTLESQASKFAYRTEAAGWWWGVWGTSILFCTALLSIFLGAWKWFLIRRNARQQQAMHLAQQRLAQIEQQKIRSLQDEQDRIENEWLVKLAHDAETAEQQCLALGVIAKQQADEAVAKLAAEQDLAVKLLASIFNASAKSKRE